MNIVGSPRNQAPSSQMVALPRLNNVSPRLLGMHPPHSLTPRPTSITTRQQRRPTPRHVKKAARQLWRTDVKRWCEAQDKKIEWGYSPREEAELTEWFNCLDINRSGTVDETEIGALMGQIGIEASPSTLTRMFAAINKPVDTRLTRTGAPPSHPHATCAYLPKSHRRRSCALTLPQSLSAS